MSGFPVAAQVECAGARAVQLHVCPWLHAACPAPLPCPCRLGLFQTLREPKKALGVLEEEAVWQHRGTDLWSSRPWSAAVAPWQPQFELGLFLGTGSVLATTEKAEKQGKQTFSKESPCGGRHGARAWPGTAPGPTQQRAADGALGHRMWALGGAHGCARCPGALARAGSSQSCAGLQARGWGSLEHRGCPQTALMGVWHSAAPPTPRSVLPAGHGVVCLEEGTGCAWHCCFPTQPPQPWAGPQESAQGPDLQGWALQRVLITESSALWPPPLPASGLGPPGTGTHLWPLQLPCRVPRLGGPAPTPL